MTDIYWKTGSVTRRRQVTWPSFAQVARQLGLVILAIGLWGALLVGYLRLTDEQIQALLAKPPESPAVAAVSPTSRRDLPTSTLAPTVITSTLAASATALIPTPTSTTTPPSAPTLEPAGVEGPSPEADASPTVAPTPLPSPPSAETPAIPAETPAAGEEASQISFARDVLPIFERRCVKCHGGEETEEGLVLKSHADVLAGSWNGPVIEPGSAEGSFLVEQIVKGKMPKKGPRLLPSEIRVISAWIDVGAPNN